MIDPATSWADGAFLAFDLETTGTDTATDRIVTAAVIAIRPGSAPVITSWLADPGIDIPAEATEVHGISTEHAREHGRDAASVVAEVGAALAEWSDTVPLCAFNASFDLSLLHAELRRHHGRDLPIGGPVVDPMIIDRALDRFRKGKRTLGALCEHYQVRLDEAHTCSADALAAARLAWRLAKNFPAEVGELPLTTLHKQQTVWWRDQKRGFASYLGRKAGECGDPTEAEDLRRRSAEVRAEGESWPLRSEDTETAEPEQRVWLDVPFADKDEAKALGARWDVSKKRWYAPNADMPELARWAALPELPEEFPGEDRTFGDGLFVDLVPSTCWFTNVRTCVSQRDWERLRRVIQRRAGHACEICGRGEDRSVRRWLEAHERWAYDEPSRTQTLRRLLCLCTDCHTATHFGLAQVKGNDGPALAHLREVTGMSATEADRHVTEAFAVWKQRSSAAWTLDLSLLTELGVTLAPPPDAEDRISAAEQGLFERGSEN